MAIYHIDDAASGQQKRGFPGQKGGGKEWPENGNHNQVAMLQADGLFELEQNKDRGDGDDLWQPGQVLGPGQSNTVFPNTDRYMNGNIMETGITITVLETTVENEVKFEVSGLGGGNGNTEDNADYGGGDGDANSDNTANGDNNADADNGGNGDATADENTDDNAGFMTEVGGGDDDFWNFLTDDEAELTNDAGLVTEDAESPTPSPTAKPSDTPTKLPTANPTATPTRVPTAKPTTPNPTVSPGEPSPLPTPVPTSRPTIATDSPSPAPSAAPTAETTDSIELQTGSAEDIPDRTRPTDSPGAPGEEFNATASSSNASSVADLFEPDDEAVATDGDLGLPPSIAAYQNPAVPAPGASKVVPSRPPAIMDEAVDMSSTGENQWEGTTNGQMSRSAATPTVKPKYWTLMIGATNLVVLMSVAGFR